MRIIGQAISTSPQDHEAGWFRNAGILSRKREVLHRNELPSPSVRHTAPPPSCADFKRVFVVDSQGRGSRQKLAGSVVLPHHSNARQAGWLSCSTKDAGCSLRED